MEQDSLDMGTARTAAALRMQLAQMAAVSHMLERSAKDEKSQEYLAMLNQSICRMLRIVGRTELTARLTENPRLNLAPVDLGQLAAGVVERAAGLLRHAGVRIDVQGPEYFPAQADKAMIRQLLLELISNAARAGDRVTLSLARDGDQAVFTVTDNGPGLSPEGLVRLFSGDEEETPDWRRQGVGVAIARRVASLHGGRLMAYSLPEGGLRVAVSISRGQVEGDILKEHRTGWDPGGFGDEQVALSDLLPAAAFRPDGDWGN